jgi:hypothetical protein
MQPPLPLHPALSAQEFTTQLGRCAVDGHSRDSVLAVQGEDLSRWVNDIQSVRLAIFSSTQYLTCTFSQWLDVTPYEHPLRPSALQLLLDLLGKTEEETLPKFLLMLTDGFLVQEPGVWRSGGSGALYKGTFMNVAAVIKKVPRIRITASVHYRKQQPGLLTPSYRVQSVRW